MKRTQGLPLNTIVLAALAVLVLLLIVGFTTGSLSKLFGGFASGTQGVDVDKARSLCQQYCAELRSAAAAGTLTKEDAENSRYSLSTFAIDINKDGTIDINEQELHCWDYPINVRCSFTINANLCWNTTSNDVCKDSSGNPIMNPADCSAAGCTWKSAFVCKPDPNVKKLVCQ